MSAAANDKLWVRFSDAPLVVQAYLAFTVIATILSFSPAFSPSLGAALVPYTGWSGLSLYVFTLQFTIVPIVSSSPWLRWTLYANVFLLGLFVVFGSLELIRHLSAPNQNFGNPYLTFHPWRPVFTIALPATWALLLLSPNVGKWVRQQPAENADDRRYQFSIIDLLYVMLTVSVSMAISAQLIGRVRAHHVQSALAPAAVIPTPTATTAPPGALKPRMPPRAALKSAPPKPASDTVNKPSP